MGFVALAEGKHFWHFDDRWGDPPRYAVSVKEVSVRAGYAPRLRVYRIAYRAISSSTNERTAVFTVLPPGETCGHSVGVEVAPSDRCVSGALLVEACANGFVFDWCLRQMVGANVTQYLLNGVPVATVNDLAPLLVHSALRLTCNHAGYGALWREQLGDAWREPGKEPFSWPVLEGDDARWAVRAAIGAVVADAYGLDRRQYEHVLSTFSHASYHRAPELCLAAFDELKAIGLEAFIRKHDPYWDIPLVETLPRPVIDLPIPEAPEAAADPAQPRLWVERGGQLATASPGHIFGQADAPRPAGRRKRAPRQRQASAEVATEQHYQALVAYLRNQGSITSADAQDHLGLPAAAVRPLLRRLVAEGVADCQGRARGTKYSSRRA